MENSEIKIKSIKLSGIKNPLLTIIVEELSESDYEFLIYADKKLVDCSIGKIDKDKKAITAILPLKCKNIEVNLKKDSQVSLVKTLKNSTIKKIFGKICSISYSVFHKLFLIINFL